MASRSDEESKYLEVVRMRRDVTLVHSSSEIARELSKQFENIGQTFKVEMRCTKEIGAFINRVESAQRKTMGSKLSFK